KVKAFRERIGVPWIRIGTVGRAHEGTRTMHRMLRRTAEDELGTPPPFAGHAAPQRHRPRKTVARTETAVPTANPGVTGVRQTEVQRGGGSFGPRDRGSA